ncbi:MAG: PAS domain S-box protein [Chthoniobacteraceae bacterium]|jgi:PAS domain S-box-containing protein
MSIANQESAGASGQRRIYAWQRAAICGLAFYLCALVARYLSVPGAGYVTFWLPPGIYFAALLLSEPVEWGWSIAAICAANILFDVPAGTPLKLTLWFSCANTLSATTGAWLARRFAGGRIRLATFREYAVTMGAGTIGASMSATVGTWALMGIQFSASFNHVWAMWWSCDMMAISILTPLILVMYRGSPRGTRPLGNWRAIGEAALMLCLLAGGLWYILLDQRGILSPDKSVLLLPVLWAGIRFGPRGAAWMTLLMGMLMAWFTIHNPMGVTQADLNSGEPMFVLNMAIIYASMAGLIPAIVLRERDRTLTKLRESEDRFNLAILGTSDGLWDWDISSGKVFFAPRFLELAGYEGCPDEEFPRIRATVLEHMHPEDRDRAAKAMEAHFDRRVPYDAEYRLRTRSGEYRWFRSRGQAIWDEQGQPVRMAGSIRDVTDAKQAERALRESEEKFSKAFGASPDGICISEVASGRLMEVNEAYCELYGYKREEVVGRSSVELGIFKTPQVRDHFVKTLMDCGSVRDLEMLTYRSDGQLRLVSVSAERMQLGASECIVSVIHDITERKRTEEQIRQAQRMDAIGQLAGGIAHDFNNMLAVIQMQTSMMLGELGLEEQAKEDLRNIMAAAEKSANLTRQLLTFSRQSVPRTENLDLVEVIGAVIKLLRRVLGENISLETRFASGLPLVNADPGMIEQVIMNLSINARDAMPRGGRLEVNLDACEIDAGRAGQHGATPGTFVRLVISDTGCGIAREQLPRIFEPFFTTKKVGEGTGLGLATAFGVVQQHQGWIEVESEVGRGTAFTVYLPALEAGAVASSPAAAVLKVRGGNEKILLVEDDETVRELTRHVLEKYGYVVREATTPEEALQARDGDGGEVDLLLTDIIMPGEMNGRELADELIGRQPGLKVMYVSGYSHEVLDHQLRIEQRRAFLQKPFTALQLASCVRRCLDGEEG